MLTTKTQVNAKVHRKYLISETIVVVVLVVYNEIFSIQRSHRDTSFRHDTREFNENESSDVSFLYTGYTVCFDVKQMLLSKKPQPGTFVKIIRHLWEFS